MTRMAQEAVIREFALEAGREAMDEYKPRWDSHMFHTEIGSIAYADEYISRKCVEQIEGQVAIEFRSMRSLLIALGRNPNHPVRTSPTGNRMSA